MKRRRRSTGSSAVWQKPQNKAIRRTAANSMSPLLRARAARWTRAILAKHPNWDNSNDSNAASALGGSVVPIPRRTFYFLRHGETDWNVEGRFQGHSDIPLNAQGLAQARSAAQIMADRSVDLIVASPLIRALKTAAIVAEAIGKPLRIDSEL